MIGSGEELFGRAQAHLKRLEELVAAELQAQDQTGAFFRNILDPACVANREYFLLVNDAWTRVLGWSQDEMLGRPWATLIHPDDLEKTIAMAEAQSKGTSAMLFQNRYRHKDGGYVLLEWSAPPWDERGFTYAVARPIGGRRTEL